jgi:hypothetical protein
MNFISRLSICIALTAVASGCAAKYPYPGGDAAGDADAWTTILARQDLAGWKPFLQDSKADPAATWSVKDGVLTCMGNPVGYIATTETYIDYELELEWRFDPKKGPGNGGVLLRVQKDDAIWPKSIEAQLESGNAGDFWNIGNFPAKMDAARTDGRHTVRMGKCSETPLGLWNRYRIVVDGSRIELYVNGELQNVATDVEHVGGRIALQSEGAYMQFRNIRIRPLLGKGNVLGFE